MTPDADQRSATHRMRDDEIAAEPQMPPLEIAANAIPRPLGSHFGKSRRHPAALTGIVENGVVHIVDPGVKLPEHSRVIIVAATE